MNTGGASASWVEHHASIMRAPTLRAINGSARACALGSVQGALQGPCGTPTALSARTSYLK